MTEELNALFLNNFIKNTNTPVLFHYTSVDAADLIENTKKLRLSKHDSVNDNHEFLYGLHKAIAEIKRISKKDRIIHAIIEKYIPFLIDEAKNPQLALFMTCFSRNSNSKYLWTKYAQNKSGKLVEINFHANDFTDVPMVARDVFYRMTRFRKLLKTILVKYKIFIILNIQMWIDTGRYDIEMKQLILTLHRDIFILAAFFKRRKYRKECEYRIVVFKDLGDASIFSRRSFKTRPRRPKNTSAGRKKLIPACNRW